MLRLGIVHSLLENVEMMSLHDSGSAEWARLKRGTALTACLM